MLDAALRVFGWIGAAQAALLAAALLTRRASSASDRWLGAGLAAAALAAALISLSGGARATPAFEAAEVVVTLAAGPIFTSWIAHLVGWRAPRGVRVLAFAPAAAWAFAALAGWPGAWDGRAIRWAVVFLFSWSVASAALAAARWRRVGARARGALALGLAGILLLHVAQAARLAAPLATPPHLVSATIGVLLVLVSFGALRTARLAVAVGAGSAGDDREAAELVAACDRRLVAERLFVEPGLQLATLAERLGTTSVALSRALNRHAGTTFSERVAELRIDEAKRLLADPGHDHLAVEAIGGRAGFRSKSAFYAEFRRRTGRAPAEFREAAAAARRPAPPSGAARTS